MDQTTQGETMKNQEQSEKEANKNSKSMKRLLRNQTTANKIMESEQKVIKEEYSRAFNQYIEFKMLKGHSKEQATKMAEAVITKKQV